MKAGGETQFHKHFKFFQPENKIARPRKIRSRAIFESFLDHRGDLFDPAGERVYTAAGVAEFAADAVTLSFTWVSAVPL